MRSDVFLVAGYLERLEDGFVSFIFVYEWKYSLVLVTVNVM